MVFYSMMQLQEMYVISNETYKIEVVQHRA